MKMSPRCPRCCKPFTRRITTTPPAWICLPCNVIIPHLVGPILSSSMKMSPLSKRRCFCRCTWFTRRIVPLCLTVSKNIQWRMWRNAWNDHKRPLNKDQGHSFWYQSISHIRLPVCCQSFALGRTVSPRYIKSQQARPLVQSAKMWNTMSCACL